MKYSPLPSTDYLKERLDYDPVSGVAKWLPRTGPTWISRWNSRLAGKVAGGKVGSYLTISIDDHNYLLHRVIYKWMTGSDPTEQIDHINGNKLDNRWDNLRSATPSQNRCNTTTTSRSVSGIKGVRQNTKGLWQGIVTLHGKAYKTAWYSTANEAAESLNHIRLTVHGTFAQS